MDLNKKLCDDFSLDYKILNYINQEEKSLCDVFQRIDEIVLYNQTKVLRAMQECKLCATDFHWSTGYGYSDIGRDKTEMIYSKIFNTEDALVRPNIVSGTHAISLCLYSLLRKNDKVVSITSSPYDTLQKVIGTKGSSELSLINEGIIYEEIPLKDKKIDYENIKNYVDKNTKMVILQRSTGYSDRSAFTVSKLKRAVSIIRQINEDIIVFLDNCYGEFTEEEEPSVFCDITAGSLIKNPGGGLAYSGGYVVGLKKYINIISQRLTAPGLGKDLGLTFGTTRNTLQGLFLAPRVVGDCLKSSVLYSKIFTKLGYKCIPTEFDKRSDIVLSIELKDAKLLENFLEIVQSSSPVDSIYKPLPWDMPGYEDKVIMASGSFIEGSSIELSADGPMREPYYAYIQGALTYEHSKYCLIKLLEKFKK